LIFAIALTAFVAQWVGGSVDTPISNRLPTPERTKNTKDTLGKWASEQ
jgi:hypothetical protein